MVGEEKGRETDDKLGIRWVGHLFGVGFDVNFALKVNMVERSESDAVNQRDA